MPCRSHNQLPTAWLEGKGFMYLIDGRGQKCLQELTLAPMFQDVGHSKKLVFFWQDRVFK